MLKALKKGNNVDVLCLSKSGYELELCKMNLQENILVDGLGQRQYVVEGSPLIDITIGRKRKRVYFVDDNRGCTITMVRDLDSLLKLKTSPEHIAAIIDSAIVRFGWELQADKRSIAIAFLLGGLLFGFLALLV